MIHLGKTAKYLRQCKGLTQSAAAESLGITQVYLSNIENNKAVPSQRLLDRYREVFGVDLYILAWTQFGDTSKLPETVRKPMSELAKAWKSQLEGLHYREPAVEE